MIYLDSAATSFLKPPQVAEAVCQSFGHIGNAGRGAHAPTLNASRLLYSTREKLAQLFHAEAPACIAFASNATQALNTAINGLIGPEDHVITTVCEHNSVLRPLFRKEKNGTQLSIVPADEKGNISPELLSACLRSNTRAIVMHHASNITGNVTDLEKIADIAHTAGALLIVDAAQTAGSLPIDVQRMGIDVLCFTGHKGLMGPQGTGGIYVRKDLQIPSFLVGGSGVHSFSHEHPADYPTALEAGTLNTPGIAGLSAALDFVMKTGPSAIHMREIALARAFYDAIRRLDGVMVYGDWTTDNRAAIVTLGLSGWDAGEVSDVLMQDYGICTRAGAHCAPLVHRAFGTEHGGLVRFSFSYFNTEDEVRAAVDAVTELTQEDS